MNTKFSLAILAVLFSAIINTNACASVSEDMTNNNGGNLKGFKLYKSRIPGNPEQLEIFDSASMDQTSIGLFNQDSVKIALDCLDRCSEFKRFKGKFIPTFNESLSIQVHGTKMNLQNLTLGDFTLEGVKKDGATHTIFKDASTIKTDLEMFYDIMSSSKVIAPENGPGTKSGVSSTDAFTLSTFIKLEATDLERSVGAIAHPTNRFKISEGSFIMFELNSNFAEYSRLILTCYLRDLAQ